MTEAEKYCVTAGVMPTSSAAALPEDITPGGGLEGRVSRRGWVDSDWIEAKHVNDCNRYVVWELVHQREVIFGFDRSVR